MWPIGCAPGGVLILDDPGFVKKGRVSAGVSRQYTGTSGKVDNCQIGVFAAYASPRGRALVDRELYLPKCWTEDAARCEAAKMPAGRGFATKNELGRAMLARNLDAGLPVAGVAADEAYGQEWKLRRLCEERGVGYVLAVPKSQQVRSSAGMRRNDTLVDHAPPEAWERHTACDGAKGPRLYDWAGAVLPPVVDFDEHRPAAQRWLLARRSLAEPGEIAYYLAYARTAPRCPNSPASPGCAGRSRSASRPRRTKPDWTSTRCGATRAGTGTSPSPCSPTPSSPP
jgi:hypothetical protein